MCLKKLRTYVDVGGGGLSSAATMILGAPDTIEALILRNFKAQSNLLGCF